MKYTNISPWRTKVVLKVNYGLKSHLQRPRQTRHFHFRPWGIGICIGVGIMKECSVNSHRIQHSFENVTICLSSFQPKKGKMSSWSVIILKSHLIKSDARSFCRGEALWKHPYSADHPCCCHTTLQFKDIATTYNIVRRCIQGSQYLWKHRLEVLTNTIKSEFQELWCNIGCAKEMWPPKPEM